MSGNKHWEKKHGFLSEFQIDARWILREDGDPDTAWGSLRIVSFPDMQAGYLKAIANIVTSRRPRTKEEIDKLIEESQMDITELEIYSADEEITIEDMIHEAPKRDLEEMFGVKIFGN